jgi:hypothetical protein
MQYGMQKSPPPLGTFAMQARARATPPAALRAPKYFDPYIATVIFTRSLFVLRNIVAAKIIHHIL